MSDKSKIEWTEATWNPVTGCTKVSPGCDHCYAETFAERWRGVPGHAYENGFDVTLRPERLDQPLRWKKPRRVFVNSMSDLFHDAVPDEFIARVFAVMALAPQHTFQVLTKRHGRMRSLLTSPDFTKVVARTAVAMAEAAPGPPHLPDHLVMPGLGRSWWPLPNVWLGVSVEDQKRADLRVPALIDTPAAVRWLSCEPLLGPVDLTELAPGRVYANRGFTALGGDPHVDWVVVGGESGHGARPMLPDWARGLRDQCTGAGVPFFFKQWGNWAPDGDAPYAPGTPPNNHSMVWCASKKLAGRELDGRTWDEYPREATA